MPFDFKQYRKVHHTPHHSIFRHADGHEIKVLHDKLDPKMKSEVMRLPKRNAAPVEGYADGGKVKPAPQPTPQGPQVDPKDAANVRKAFVGYSNGTPEGPITGLNAASAADPAFQPSLTQDYLEAGLQNRAPMSRKEAPREPGAWERLTTPIPGASHLEGVNTHPDAIYTPQGTMEHSLGSPDLVQQAPPAVSQGPQNFDLGSSEQPQQQTAPETDFYGDYASQLDKGFSEQRRGVQGEAAALGAQGRDEAGILGKQQEEQATLQKDTKRHFDELNADFEAAYSDLRDGHIDPNHYMGSMDTGAKVTTAIGLLLGGLGGGLTGQGNPALDFLNKQIDRDIAGQQANLNKKETLLSANLKHFGNVRDAVEATRVMMMDGVKLGLQKAAASTQDPLAQARALQAVGVIDNKRAEATLGLSTKRALMTAGATGNPDKMLQQMRVIDPARAKELEGRYVPGIGFASVPIEPKVRDELSIRHELDTKLSRLEAFAHKHSGSLDPAIIAEGKALSQDTQDVYRRANGQGVFREAEAAFVNKMIDTDPTKFFGNFRTLPAYRAVREGNASALDGRLRSVGLPVPPRAKRNNNVK